jgi:elongator complex protein 3
MPNLPGSTHTQDLELFDELFSNSNYRPDMLKIYPTLVINGTELYRWWKQGRYSPYSDEELIKLLVKVKSNLPSYVRIQRIMRDIPANLIEAGCKNSNLRQLVQRNLQEINETCKCIRCREYGISKNREIVNENSLNKVKLYRQDYEASKGQEVFLSYENQQENYLVGYLRLRKPSELAHRPEINDGKTMIVREIKVVGELVPKDMKPNRYTQIQHRGYGKMLMQNAEKIAREEFDVKKLAVISGIGVRDFFRNIGHKLEGVYMSKVL